MQFATAAEYQERNCKNWLKCTQQSGWNSRYNISSDWKSWICHLQDTILWDILTDTCTLEKLLSVHCKRCQSHRNLQITSLWFSWAMQWKLGIKRLSFCKGFHLLHCMSVQILLLEREKEKQPWKLEINFDISGNRLCVLAKQRNDTKIVLMIFSVTRRSKSDGSEWVMESLIVSRLDWCDSSEWLYL